jgi:hypothetical protein
MQDFTETTETSASSISLGSYQEYYTDLPDQYHLDLPGESSTSFTGTATIENDDADNNDSTRELKHAASNSNSPFPSSTTQPKPRFALSFTGFEHSTFTPVTLATTFTASSSSSKDSCNKLPMPPLNASHASPPSCPPVQLQVQSAVPALAPLEVEDTDSSQCHIKGKNVFVVPCSML